MWRCVAGYVVSDVSKERIDSIFQVSLVQPNERSRRTLNILPHSSETGSERRSRWPRGLTCGSAAARLLVLWFWIPPRTWVSVASVVCCQVETSASGWSLVQRSTTECGVSECDRETLIMRRPWPTRGCCATRKKNKNLLRTQSMTLLTSSVHIVGISTFITKKFRYQRLWK